MSNPFAIIETGGKQYKVEKATKLEVEKLGEMKGKTVKFQKVLLFSDGKSVKIGKPYLDNTEVTAKILDERKGKKVIVFKKKAKKRYQKKQGHRQTYTVIEIENITTK